MEAGNAIVCLIFLHFYSNWCGFYGSHLLFTMSFYLYG